jgi:hypothetical protein
MILHIEKLMTLEQVQDAFSRHYPHLKLVYFIDRNKDNHLNSSERIQNLKMTIGSIREVAYDGYIQIEPNMTVMQVEKAFWDSFGLNVQIFRKSGRNWLMTHSSDLWTLEEQDKKAEEMDMEIEQSDIPDYKEQE